MQQENIIALLSELIICPSITPNDAGCQDLLQKHLEKLNFQCKSLDANGVKNLWARFGTEAPLFVFAGHTDVVPAGSESSWTSPPFSPTVRDGKLFGRGACDMKGAIACMVVAVDHFLKKSPNFKGSIAFLITSDEEGDALYGTQHVLEELEKQHTKIDYCVIGEASSEHEVGDQIRVGRRGSLHGHLTVQGRQGHVAYPERVINPIHQFSAALHELSEIAWDEESADFPKTTFQFTNLNSGTGALNVVPDTLSAAFNFRFGTQSTVESLQQKTESILKKSRLNYQLKWTIGALPFLSKRGSFTTRAEEAIQKITGKKPISSTGGGTSDGRFIIKTGAELFELGVLHHTAHQINEHVSIEALDTLCACYESILASVLM